MKPVGNKQSPTSSGDEFEVLFQDEASDRGKEEAESALRAFFGRKVTVRTGEPAQPSEAIPEKERFSFSKPLVLRALSSLLSLISSESSKGGRDDKSGSEADHASGYDQWDVVMDNRPKEHEVTGGGESRSRDWNVMVKDGELVQSLGKKTFASLPVENNSLLPPQFSLGDICQSDQRSTCYILSAAAAYVFSEPGKIALRGMFTDEGNGVGVVRLYDDILRDDVFVQVSLNPIFVDKVLIYSFSSRGNVWPLALEKAIHGLNLAFVQAWGEQKEALSEDNFCRLRAELSSVLTDKDKAKLDYDDLASAMKRFPAVGGNAKNVCLDVQTAKLFSSDPFQRWITSSLQAGVPVVLGTRKLAWSSSASLFKQIGSTLKSGTPTGHAVAVLKAHELKGKGCTKKGVLIFDPYGEKKGRMPSDEEIRSDHFNPSANGAVQFVPWEKVPEYFSEVCFAKGAPRLS